MATDGIMLPVPELGIFTLGSGQVVRQRTLNVSASPMIVK
jgi:hypothetical protein